jgi:tetrathionate reductase subunit B
MSDHLNPPTQQDRGFDAYRRRFLGMAAVGGASLPAGLMLIDLAHGKPDDAAVTGRVRWGMLIDSSKCADGCDACVTACETENGWRNEGRETDPQWIRKVELVNRKTGKSHTLPMLCQHCEHPPCVDVCPTGASFRRADGIVLVDRHICIGCRYCMMACPYKARSFIHEDLTDQVPDVPRGKGCVESCTFCVHRVDRGRIPACVEACSGDGHDALMFGDLNDPQSEIAKRLATEASKEVRADLGLNTGVRYQGI